MTAPPTARPTPLDAAVLVAAVVDALDRLTAAITAAGGIQPTPMGLTLTARQAEIMAMVAEGLTKGQIAGRMFLAESTVKRHLERAYQALGAHSAAEAVAIAVHAGLIPAPHQKETE